MIDNFEKIKNVLKFENKDVFYFCQMIKRRKEYFKFKKIILYGKRKKLLDNTNRKTK